jgi:SagB-type dehydrogenase family enzyme
VSSQAWQYHDLTKHSYWSVRTNPHYLDWHNLPNPFKEYSDLPRISLPEKAAPGGISALQAIAANGSTRAAATESGETVVGINVSGSVRPDLSQLASLLYYSAGVTKQRRYPEVYFRAAACAGALYPVEVYVVCGELQGLHAGLYHFSPRDFALVCLRETDCRPALLEATAGEPHLAAAPIALIYTAITWRSSWKYRDRSYRYHFWDNGMIVGNAMAEAAALGLPAHLVMGFIDHRIDRLLGIDGERELPLSILTFGSVSPEPSAPAGDLPELRWSTAPLSYSEVDYPSIRQMHTATSLSTPDEVSSWRGTPARGVAYDRGPVGESEFDDGRKADDGERCAVGGGEGRFPLAPLSPLSDANLPREGIENVIVRRGSTRRFALKAMSYPELSTILDRSTREISADFRPVPESQMNDVYMIVNRVDGLSAGSYYYDRSTGSLELLKTGDFHQQATHLVLDQDLGGDASITLFFMADLGPIFARLGGRGYRAVQMESGIIGSKMYIAAYALGRGATGLTFYDDEVTEFFSPHAAGKSCILALAIGVPGKRPLL